MSKRLLVIGLDGADREALLHGINSGRLETFQQIATTGTLTHLEAPHPPITPVSMASILTGTQPSHHGVHGFERTRGGYVDYSDIDGKTLFTYLSDNNLKTISINLPMTSPPPEDADAVISGFPITTPSITHPPQLRHILPETYRTEPDPGEDQETFVRQVFDIADQRFTIASDLITHEWDVFMLMFTGDARLQHFINDEDIIARFYEKIDRYVKQLYNSVEDDPHLLIVSDHGFYPLEATFNIQAWLRQHNYLVTTDEQVTDNDLYGRLDHDSIDHEASTAYPCGAYMAPIAVANDTVAEEIIDSLQNITYDGKNVFIDVEKYDDRGSIFLSPVPRRRFNYKAVPSDALYLDTDEIKSPDREGVILSNTPLTADRTPRSVDILPTLLSLLDITPATEIDGISLIDT